MVGCKTLNDISRNLCYPKTGALPFGGLYVLFTGNLHQLPYIGDRNLYIDCRDECIRARCELSPLQKNYIAGTLELWESGPSDEEDGIANATLSSSERGNVITEF